MRFGFHFGGGSPADAEQFSLGGRAVAAALTPTQALIASFAGTGLLDALLLFDPTHYATPGSTPGVLVDALGGPITYTAPNTQATPSAVQDASGYWLAQADGVDDTIIASANQPVAWYCAVMKSPQALWNNYGCPLGNLLTGARLGYCTANGTSFGGGARVVRRNGVTVGGGDLAPINAWMLATVSADSASVSQVLQIAGMENHYYLAAGFAAIAIRYADPTAAQQTAIEANLTPMQQALSPTA